MIHRVKLVSTSEIPANYTPFVDPIEMRLSDEGALMRATKITHDDSMCATETILA